MYAARKGDKIGNNDMTFYALIVQMKNGNKFKILETKKITKIKKELLCIKKFLVINEDPELTIIDEREPIIAKKLKQERKKAEK